MSCPSQITCLLYAEGELVGSALRDTEAHLVGCRDCRARVVALREESALLGEVLREEAATERAVAAPAPEPGVALGVPIAIAAATAAIAVASALVEARLPGALDLLHPRRLKGAAEMAFDLVFFVRASAPGLIELAFSVGVMASVSALGSFAVSVLARRWFGGALALAFALAAAPGEAHAFVVRGHDGLHVASGERIEESVLAHGDRVEIDGTIDGDLVAAAERVTIRGEVTGSLYVFCRDLEVTGSIGQVIHAVAERARFEGSVRGGVYVLADEVILTSTAKVRADVNSVAEDLVVEGSVGRDLYASGDRLDLRGSVGRHVRSHWLEELDLRDGSRVGGDVEVRLAEGREIARAPGARVQGEVRTSVAPSHHEHYLDHYRSWRFYAGHLLWFAAAFVFGLLVHWIAPAAFRGAISTGGELFRTLALGFVVLVVAPVAIVAVALTVVGIPVALLGLFAYVAALYTADLAVGAWLGRWIAPPADGSTFAFGRSLAVGLAIVTAVTLVPFLGPPAGFVAMLIGLGMLSARAREALD